LEKLRTESSTYVATIAELRAELTGLTENMRAAEGHRDKALTALTDIQNDVKAAVEARDKAQRDVHFMLVEQQKKEDASVVNDLQARLVFYF
jgi:argininosuccinate lyase